LISAIPVLFLSAAGLIALKLVAVFKWPTALWGLSQLAVFPANVTLVLGLLALTCLLVAQPRPFAAFVSARIDKLRLSRATLFGGAIVSSLLVFHLLRMRHWLFGDAHVLFTLNHDLGFKFGAGNVLFFQGRIQAYLAPIMQLDNAAAYVLVSYACGVATVCIALVIAETIGTSKINKLFSFSTIVLTGSIQMFFGYVETYPPVTATASFVFLCLIKWDGFRGGWLIGALLASIFSFILHPIAIYLTVPLVCAFIYQFRPGSGGSRRDVVILSVALLVSLGAGSWWIISSEIDSALALGNESSYTLFSFYHLADVINEYFLLVPLHGVLCTVAWWLEKRRHAQSSVQICLVAGTIAAFGTHSRSIRILVASTGTCLPCMLHRSLCLQRFSSAATSHSRTICAHLCSL
jgi:hypothetical protein